MDFQLHVSPLSLLIIYLVLFVLSTSSKYEPNEMAVSIIDKQIPTASLLHHLDSALTCNTTAKSVYLFILDGKTVSFIPMPHSQILLVDSHLHGNTGALVAHSQRRDLPQLLSWFKEFNAFQYTLGTVTKITFN